MTAVTAFVPIPGHPRSAEEYRRLGQRLLDVEIPLMFTVDEVENCWLYRYLHENHLTFTHSVSDNPAKHSVAYHVIQAQKSEWLATAALSRPEAEVLVWIDFGIFNQPTITADVIQRFMERVKGERAIAIPGCWDKDCRYDDNHPCWRFCGGVIIVPRHLAIPFDTAMKREYIRWIRATGNLSWEVNTMTRLERERPDLPIWHYKADHDHTMFSNYRAGESRVN